MEAENIIATLLIFLLSAPIVAGSLSPKPAIVEEVVAVEPQKSTVIANNTSRETYTVNHTIANKTIYREEKPKPTYVPELWTYQAVKSEIWHPADATRYVMPRNEYVQWYASQLSLTSDSKYTHFKYPDGSRFTLRYQRDYPREDYWQNPDYTLYHGRGDCEDIAVVVASILRAKGLDAVVVSGYKKSDAGWIRHTWTEYHADNNYNYYYVDFSVDPSDGRAVVYYTLRTETYYEFFKPLYMFSDRMRYRDYNPRWEGLF